MTLSAVKDSPRFRFPLPFDPVRLLAGVLSRWPWIAIGTIIVGTLGTILGIQITHPSYTLSVALIKRRVPQTVQTSQTGQAYRPVDLNDATLLATLLASEPLDLALKRAKNGLDPNLVRSYVEAKQLEGTDIFYITYRSILSPEDAVSFTTIWAEQINSYTQHLQQSEAHEVRLILQKEVADLEQQLAANNLAILNFSKDKDYLGGEAQVSAALGKLSLIELQLETARTSVTAKAAQIKNYLEQIQRQSPVDMQLKTAKDELANLRATYTDANPLVQTKLQSIDYLNEQITKFTAKGQLEPDAYTGTALGNQLYLSILELNNGLLDAGTQVAALEKLYQKTTDRLAEFPAIVNAYATLKKKGDSITEGLTLMSNRLKEAEIFASGAPGYWQVFQAPDPRNIVPSSLIKKPAIVGLASGILGAVLSTLLSLLLSQRTTRRSVIECCLATRAPLITYIPSTYEKDARNAIDQFWITHLVPRLPATEYILFWTPALNPADERRFWAMLAAAAYQDTGKALRIFDLSPDALWSDDLLPESLEWRTLPSATPPSSPTHAATVLRAADLPHGDARELFARADYWMAVVAGHRNSLRRTTKFKALSDAYLTPCNGTIAWTERPVGHLRATADVLSRFLAKKFS